MTTTLARFVIPLALLAAFAPGAHAQSEKSREQVKLELAEAIRAGDSTGRGEIGPSLGDPQRRLAATTATTRAQVKAELAQATRAGNVMAAGEGGLNVNESAPWNYPAIVASTRSRQEVKAELAEAIRTGDLVASGEGGQTLAEEFPQRYAKARSRYAGGTPTMAAALAASAAGH